MPKLITTELANVLGSLAEVLPFDPATESNYASGDDLFLCALGFEDRCLALPGKLGEIGYKSKYSVYFRYKTNSDENSKNEDKLKLLLGSFSEISRPFEVEYGSLSHEVRSYLLSYIEQHQCRPRITIDISSFSSRLLLTILSIAFSSDISLRILYSEAAQYRPTEEEFSTNPEVWLNNDSLALESGIGEVQPSIENTGVQIDHLPHCVFHFPNFKQARGNAILYAIDPSLVDGRKHDGIVWFIGEPPSNINKWRTEAIKSINRIPDDSICCYVSTLLYKDSLQSLESQYQNYWKDYNISITNLGSKMQTIAISLFCRYRTNVRVVEASPKEYNAKEYSSGFASYWKIDFGNTMNVMSRLNSIGQISLVTAT